MRPEVLPLAPAAVATEVMGSVDAGEFALEKDGSEVSGGPLTTVPDSC